MTIFFFLINMGFEEVLQDREGGREILKIELSFLKCGDGKEKMRNNCPLSISKKLLSLI